MAKAILNKILVPSLRKVSQILNITLNGRQPMKQFDIMFQNSWIQSSPSLWKLKRRMENVLESLLTESKKVLPSLLNYYLLVVKNQRRWRAASPYFLRISMESLTIKSITAKVQAYVMKISMRATVFAIKGLYSSQRQRFLRHHIIRERAASPFLLRWLSFMPQRNSSQSKMGTFLNYLGTKSLKTTLRVIWQLLSFGSYFFLKIIRRTFWIRLRGIPFLIRILNSQDMTLLQFLSRVPCRGDSKSTCYQCSIVPLSYSAIPKNMNKSVRGQKSLTACSACHL